MKTCENRKVKIALAQVTAINGDKERNLKTAMGVIDDIADEKADIIVFPELFYSGYNCSKEELFELAEPKDGTLFQTLKKKAIEYSIHIAIGYPEIDPDTKSLYISFMMIDDKGDLIANHRKTYIWIEDIGRVTPGDGFNVIDTKFGKLGLLTCYEMEFPEPARILALKGAELTLVSSAFMDVELMEKDIIAIAVQNSMHVAGVNNFTDNYPGRSLFSDQYGNVTALASSKHEEILIHTIDLSQDRRKTYPAYNDFFTLFAEDTYKLYSATMNDICKGKR